MFAHGTLCNPLARTRATRLRSVSMCYFFMAIRIPNQLIPHVNIINLWRFIQGVRKVAVHLGYGRVQLECDGTRWRTDTDNQIYVDCFWLATHSIRHFPLYFSSRASPCAITIRLYSTVASVHSDFPNTLYIHNSQYLFTVINSQIALTPLIHCRVRVKQVYTCYSSGFMRACIWSFSV